MGVALGIGTLWQNGRGRGQLDWTDITNVYFFVHSVKITKFSCGSVQLYCEPPFCPLWLSQYRIVEKVGGGKFGEFGESSVIHQTKTIQISTYN